MKASVTMARESYERGKRQGIYDAVESMTAAMTLVLADDCGMGEECLVKTIRRFNEVFDSVNKKRITIQDIVDTLREEYNINIEVTKR